MDIPKKQENINMLKILALLISIAPTILFILAHISAYFYYTHFGIDYLKYTDPTTAFSFALESMSIVFNISIAITIILTIIFLFYFLAKHNLKVLKVYSAAIVIILTLVWFLTDAQNPLNYRDSIKNKDYIPHEVSFNNGEQVLMCVVSIGSIGQFRAFITENFQPILIPKNQITYIKPLFLPAPIKEINKGKKTLINPRYEEEMSIWFNKWKDICDKNKENNFEIFDFNKANIRNEWTKK